MDDNFELILVEEQAVAEVQSMVMRLLRDKKISQKALAEKMGVSASYISQLLSDEPKNLTIKKAAHLFYHLGEPLVFHCDRIAEMDEAAWSAKKTCQVQHDAFRAISTWTPCNSNDSWSTAQDPVAA